MRKTGFLGNCALAGTIALGLIGVLAPVANAATTVTLWSWRTEDEAAMRRIFDAFEAKNPDIKVKLQFTPDADYQNRLSTALRGGQRAGHRPAQGLWRIAAAASRPAISKRSTTAFRS